MEEKDAEIEELQTLLKHEQSKYDLAKNVAGPGKASEVQPSEANDGLRPRRIAEALASRRPCHVPNGVRVRGGVSHQVRATRRRPAISAAILQ